MAATWQRILRMEPGEGRRVLQFAALGLLLQAGLAFGSAGADALFLTYVGADKLPHIYLLMPVLMAGYIPAYSFLLSRWGVARVFDLTLGLLVAGGLVLWLLFQSNAAGGASWLYYAAKLYSALWYVGIYTLFWNFLDGYFDLRDAKRLFALFAAGMAIGAIIGGSLVGPVSNAFGVAPLFLAWSVTAVLAWPLLLWSRRTTRPIAAEDDAPADAAGSGLGEIRRTLGHLVRSPFALALTLLLFGTLVTATLCEYQYMGVFAEGLAEADLAALFGQLNAMVNVLNLAITLLFFNRLVNRLGVTGVAFIQPVTYALVFTWLLLDRGFLSAAAGFVAFQGIMTAIDFNNVNLLFSGLPAARRKQLRTLIEGFAEPIATASAGLFLIFLGDALSPANLSMIGVLAALACLALAFVVQACFGAAITANRRASWLDFSRARPAPPPSPAPQTSPPASAETDDLAIPARREPVLRALLDLPVAALPADDEFLPALLRVVATGPASARRLALDLLERLGDARATAEILRFAQHYHPGEHRRVEQLLLAFGPRTTPALSQIAEDPAFPVQGRRLALRVLGRLAPAQARAIADPLILGTLRRAYVARGNFFVLAQIEHPTPALAVLLRVNRDLPKLALEIVLEALSVADRLARPEAVLAALFSDASKERGYAIESIEQACPRPILELLLPLLDENTIPAQVALGRARGLIADTDVEQVLTHALNSSFPLEVSAAAQFLRERRGPAADPTLVATLAATPSAMLRDTLAALWRRPAAPATSSPPPPTPVEIIDHLMRWPRLRGALFTHFEMLGPQARLIDTPAPLPLLTPATPPAAPLATDPGAIVGLDELLTASLPARPVVAAAGSRLLHLPAEALRETARVHPAFGLVLLRHHLQLAPAA